MPPPSAVTVAVVVKDRLQLMEECLAALAVQDHPSYDVLVVDNGSTDGTFEMVQAQLDTFPVPLAAVEVTGPLGLARQTAAQLASASVVAFTDSDCLPEPGWLSALTAPLSAGVDVVQGRTEPQWSRPAVGRGPCGSAPGVTSTRRATSLTGASGYWKPADSPAAAGFTPPKTPPRGGE